MILEQKQIFHKLADERLEEITELDKKVNADNLIYKYKGPTTNAKFNELDIAFNLIRKMKEGGIILADAKNDKLRFKSNLGEIKK